MVLAPLGKYIYMKNLQMEKRGKKWDEYNWALEKLKWSTTKEDAEYWWLRASWLEDALWELEKGSHLRTTHQRCKRGSTWP